jgi:hypothetical protein
MKSAIRESKRRSRIEADLRLTPAQRLEAFAAHSRHMVKLAGLPREARSDRHSAEPAG